MLVRNMRRELAKRRAVMQDALISTNIEIAGASRFGGSSFWVKGPTGMDAGRLAETLLQDSVLIEPGAPFFDGVGGNTSYFRLGFSSISTDKIKDGIKLIDKRIVRMRQR